MGSLAIFRGLASAAPQKSQLLAMGVPRVQHVSNFFRAQQPAKGGATTIDLFWEVPHCLALRRSPVGAFYFCRAITTLILREIPRLGKKE